MRRNELRTARGFLEALIQVNQDCHWWIEGIVVPVISEDGKTATFHTKVKTWNGNEYVEELKQSRSFSSDNNRISWDPSNFPYCFGWQEAGCCEDDYHGEMLFPIEGAAGEFLLVGFNC